MTYSAELSELPYYGNLDLVAIEPVMKPSKWGKEGEEYVSGYTATLQPIEGGDSFEIKLLRTDPLLGALLYFAHNPDKTAGQCVKFMSGDAATGNKMRVIFPVRKVVEK